MAWDHNARNRSAEVRRVNYHEDGPGKRSSSSGGSSGNDSGGNGGGDLNGVAKAIIGGIFIFALGSAGLGWVTDTIDNVKTAIEAKEKAKELAKDAKESEKAEKKLDRKVNDDGYVDKYDTEPEKLELEAGDVADVLEEIDNYFKGEKNVEITNVIYVENEVFDNSATYKATILDRLHLYSEPVAFVTVYNNKSEKKLNEIHEDVYTIICNNLEHSHPTFNKVQLKSVQGIPDEKGMACMVGFYHED